MKKGAAIIATAAPTQKFLTAQSCTYLMKISGNFVSSLTRLNRFRNTVVDVLTNWLVLQLYPTYNQAQSGEFKSGYNAGLCADREILSHITYLFGSTIFDQEKIEAARLALAGSLAKDETGDFSPEWLAGFNAAERHSEYLDRMYATADNFTYIEPISLSYFEMVGVQVCVTRDVDPLSICIPLAFVSQKLT